MIGQGFRCYRQRNQVTPESAWQSVWAHLSSWSPNMSLERKICGTLALVVLFALPSGCATPVFVNLGNTLPIAPIDVQQSMESFEGAEVLWGGRVVSLENLQDSTRVEIIAFPLNQAQQPVPDAGSIGRFMLLVPGFAEPRDYAPGRHLTAQGIIAGFWHGQSDGQDYAFPVLLASAVNVWPWGFMLDSGPQISIGFGIESQHDY